MDELVKLVTDKVGISGDQAQKAVTTVIGFLKEKLPAPIAQELDKVVAGGAGGSGNLGGMADAAKGALGGLFGKK
jgi:hypothetical protein